jgi:iron complex outermembrane receptor protein
MKLLTATAFTATALAVTALTAAAVLFPLAGPARAQDPDGSLGTVVVTATRGPKSLTDVPGTVHVLTRADIERRNAPTADSLIKAIPGFSVRRDSDYSSLNPYFSVRGVASSRVLFLLDGVAFNEGRTGGAYLEGLQVDLIDSVEAVKGPFSSLYGSQGMGGVVNIRTLMPERRVFKARVGYGSGFSRGRAHDDAFVSSVYFGDRLDNGLSFLAGVARVGTNGFAYQKNVTTSAPTAGVTGYRPTATNSGGRAFLVGDKGDGVYLSESVTLKARYEPTDLTSISFMFMKLIYEQEYDAPHTLLTRNGEPYFGYPSTGTFETTATYRNRNVFQASLKTSLSGIGLELTVAYDDTLSYCTRTPAPGATHQGGPGTLLSAPQSGISADLVMDARVSEGHFLTWGLSYRRDRADATTHNLSNWQDKFAKTTLSSREGGKSSTFAVMVQDEIKVADTLTAYLGARVDFWETSGGYYDTPSSKTSYPKRRAVAFSPKGALVYRPLPETTLRLSIGKAFNAPTLYQLYNKYVGGYTTQANPNLRPETSVAWDFGLTQGLWEGATASATYFENHISSMIYNKTTSPTIQERTNIGKARTRGVELEFTQELWDMVKIGIDYTYTDAKVVKNDALPATEGKRLQDVPLHLLKASITVERGPITAFLSGRYISKRYQTDENTDKINNVYTSYDPAFTADFKLGYQVTQNVRASFAISNILDRKYYSYYEAPGRSFFLEVAYEY